MSGRNDNKKRELQDNGELKKIFQLLHKKTRIDFSGYKPSTINRRIHRRMMLQDMSDLKKYLDYLQNNSEEIQLLQKDLLINVTRFFRDPEKIAALKKSVFPALIANKSTQEPLRIWVPGCATGEEAYSIAIALNEFLQKHKSIPVQIFATDVNSTAIDKAKNGVYLDSIAAHLSPQRLTRFFTKVENGYLINKDLREQCIFAVHDLTKNPPFSNLDLISCQNVLIYLNATLQKKVLTALHYALQPQGFLMVGNSENVGIEKNLFQTIDSKHKIYAKKPTANPILQQDMANLYQDKMKHTFSNQKLTKMRTKKTQSEAANIVSRVEKVTRLKEALELTRKYADSIVDELNAITEELQSSNEELIVNNEELQTTNEELETSQEELQAANEELLSLNVALQQREEELTRMAAIVESSDDAIISKSCEGIITSWNHGAQRLYGYRAEEIIGKPVSVLMPPGKKSDFPKIMGMLLQGKRVEHYETQRMTKEGRILDVSLTVSPLRNAKGEIIGASKIARDITEKKQTEKNLKFLAEASKILSSSFDYKTTLKNVAKLAVPQIGDWCTVDVLSDGEIKSIAVAHKDPKKVTWARELQKTYHPTVNDPQGVPHVLRTGKSELYPEISDEMLVASARDARHLKLLRGLGFTSAMIVPIVIDKEAIGAITFVTTESRRRYTKESLTIVEELASRISHGIEHARLYTEAQKAIALRDDFISMASHELKTPVTSLKIYTQGLQKQIEITDKNMSIEQLKKMNNQVDKLAMLITDLLNVSRMQLGKLEFNEQSFNLNKQVKETIESIQSTTKKHKIIVEGTIEKNVWGDKDRIGQVLTNLLTNAIKYSPLSDKIIVQLSSEKDVAVVSVQDFGIGIEKQHLNKLFNRFYRVTDPNEKTFPGLGIGLYISYDIIRRHNGTMSVTSNKGVGSQFSFTLPYKRQ